MNRRVFLQSGLGAVACGGAALAIGRFCTLPSGGGWSELYGPQPPAFSIIPVVGDGTWIWTKPPVGQKGLLEPRPFDVSVGIEITGTDSARSITATTPVPIELPEQKIDDVRIETQGCLARLRPLTPLAAQLMLAAPGIVRGQTIRATAHFRLTLHKEYFGYEKDQFPASQVVSKDLRVCLNDGPGIQVRDKDVREMAARVAGQSEHPWDKAKAFHQWVWENIRARIGSYTSVFAALRDRVGDCEERAAVFVAFCRASGIPARLVWVPNHNWAEFYLHDEQGQGHWIPAHTSAYSWFGWTGAHEMVLQKGDNIEVPEQHKSMRLVNDWAQWMGSRPKTRFLAELKPVPPASNADAGPGARSKDENGQWLVVGNHPVDKIARH
jgi:hypothetical protein